MLIGLPAEVSTQTQLNVLVVEWFQRGGLDADPAAEFQVKTMKSKPDRGTVAVGLQGIQLSHFTSLQSTVHLGHK